MTLPLFGTLSADPSSHDIDQIAVVKGGAKAVDFNRAGGFLIDSVSKSGTSQFTGMASYQVQTDSMTEDRDTISDAEFEEDRDWATLSLGGPIVSDRLFFYGSYYRPTRERDNRANLYGDVPNFESERDEFFGKLTYTPTNKILLHGSYRDSSTDVIGASVGGSATAGTASTGSESSLEIAIAEGSWLIDDRSFATFKYTDFGNETQSRPDTVLGFTPAIDGSLNLDVNNLDQMGLFQVPTPIAGDASYNEFIGPLIEQYGFIENGVPTGGGLVGAGTTFDNNDFFRESIQVGYDRTFGETITHDVHVGYQWYKDEEDLFRTSNGWGFIEVIGGRDTFDGEPIFYRGRIQQQTLGVGAAPTIHSEFESQNFEINDTIQWQNWSFNVGVMV
ncbi:MAG: hypothetical protein R3324_16610, partial [Halobacteriales archaeon]|nr:hypothetical protein [Halobacteriales archaeon]